MRTFTDIEQLTEAVGTHLGYSPWRVITQEQVQQFADATGDQQWIHTDPARARTSGLGGTIAHGYLTLSLLPEFTAEIYDIGGVEMAINYGANRLRFPSSVPVGSRVRAGAELLSVTTAPTGKTVNARVTVECEGQEKPVCVVDCLTLLVLP